jgi:uridylate kinase
MKATKVDGIYDKDPVKHLDAVKFKELSYLDVINKKIEVMDSTAITLCMDNSIPIYVFALMKEGNTQKVVMGEEIGTIVK